MNNKIFSLNNQDTIDSIENLMEACVDCKICVKNCEMLKEFSNSPKELLSNILKDKSVDPLIPYSCNMCGSCGSVCPKDLKFDNVFMNMRKEIAANNNGVSPLKGHKAVHMHQKLSFSKMFSGIVKDNKTKEIKRIFMPGCSLTSYSPELVHKTFKYLNEKLPGTALLIECCGKPTESLGEEELFKKRYSKLLKLIDETGAEEIITACQSCFMTFSTYGLKQEIKSLWNVFKEVGLPNTSIDIGKNSDIIFSIHDACPTRYNVEIQDSIRYIMNRLNYKIEELENSRENTNCCGAGGMVFPANPKVSLETMKKTAKEAQTDYIITYCASCRESMIKGGKRSLHVLDVIFGSTCMCDDKIPQPTSTIVSWCNRYKVKVRGSGSD